MQIDLEEVPQMTIEEFADANQLVMEVKERPLPVCDKMRYYAGFKNAEVMESGCLVGAHGDGATPEEAIEDYAAEISTKKIAVDAWRPARHDITVPRLVKKKDGAFLERLPGDHFMTRAEVERLTADRDSWRRTAETLQRQLAEAREGFPAEAVRHLAGSSCHCQGSAPDVQENRHYRSCMVGRAQAFLGRRVTEQPLYGAARAALGEGEKGG